MLVLLRRSYIASLCQNRPSRTISLALQHAPVTTALGRQIQGNWSTCEVPCVSHSKLQSRNSGPPWWDRNRRQTKPKQEKAKGGIARVTSGCSTFYARHGPLGPEMEHLSLCSLSSKGIHSICSLQPRALWFSPMHISDHMTVFLKMMTLFAGSNTETYLILRILYRLLWEIL